jgi:Domain of unknown function (DUF4126)
MSISTHELAGLLIAVSFAAGLNVYATLMTLGLLAHAGVLLLPESLQMVSSWYVIGTSAALFAVELFADKIPIFDLVWNALHTFIRIPVAALFAYRAAAQLSPSHQVIAAIAGGLIAFAAHGGKTAVRAIITPSPEPLSNIALSTGEDVIAIGLTWFASGHPFIAAVIVLFALLIILIFTRLVIRSLRSLFRGAEREIAQTGRQCV